MVAAILLCGVGGALARPLPVPFRSEYLAEVWGLEQGFPQNSCSGIVESPDGYLWLGTFRGLVRFNGQEFKSWAPEAMPLLLSTGIINMHQDRKGRTWFSTVEGMVVNQGTEWRHLLEADGWDERSDYARSYAEDTAGNLVIGRFSGRVMRLEGDRLVELPVPPGSGGALCAYDGNGVLYVVRIGFVGFFEEGAWRPLVGDPALARQVVGAGQTRASQAVVVTRTELLRVQGGSIQTRVPLSREVTPFWRLTEDNTGAIWLASIDAGVFRIQPDGTVKQFLKADGLPHSGGARIVHADEHGSIWIGSGVGGFTRFRPVRFRYLGEQEGVGDREIPSLAPLDDGRLLLATYGNGLLQFDGTASTIPLYLTGAQSNYFRCILRTRDNAIWIGAYNSGLMRLEGSVLVPAAPAIFSPSDSVSTLFEDSRGRIWAGGERQIAVRQDGAFKPVELPRPNRDRRSTFFAERRDGTVLLARDNLVYAYDDEGLRPTPLVQLPTEARITTVRADALDRIWIGTLGHGLNVFHDGRLLRLDVSNGLPDGSISALIEDNLGALWFGAGRTILRANPDDLWATAENSDTPATFQLFDVDDGLRELDFPYGTQPSVAKDETGNLWFALIRGAAMIDPAALRLNDRPPKVVVEWISYVPDGAARAVEIPFAGTTTAPVLPAGSRLIRIGYAALDFAAPRKQRFRIQLGDDTGQWQDMQKETVVSFLELPPGRHTIQIQAASSDGIWSRTTAVQSFEIAPFVWQTGWFRALVGLGLVSLAGGAAWLAADRRNRGARDKLERDRRLAEAQARLGLVLENTSDFVAFADPDSHLVYVNRAGRTLIGLAADADLRTLSSPDVFAETVRSAYTKDALPAALHAGTWSGESILRHCDGHEIPVSLVVVVQRRSGGGLDFTSMIARDISTTKRNSLVQDALRRLATSLTAALEPRSLGFTAAEACRTVFGHDAFFLVLLNARGEVTLGAYMEDTDVGETEPREVPPTITSFSGQMRPVLQGSPLLVNREPELNPDLTYTFEPWGHSSRRSLSILLAPVLWEGVVVGVVSVQSYTPHRYGNTDLQQLQTLADHCGAAIARMNAEASLRKNEERLRLAMRSARMGSWEIDLETRTLRASPEAEDVYGYVRGSLSGPVSNLSARVREPEDIELRDLLDRLLKGKLAEIDHSHRIVLADDSERWLELKAHRQQQSEASGALRVIGVTADITTRRLAEIERSRLEEQLRHSQKLEAIGTLAGGIAHDFNNILTAILSNAELGLIDTDSGHPAHESLTKIKKSGQRARDLVRRILAFSRPNENRRQPIAVLPVIEEVIKLLRATIPANVEISVHAHDSVPLVDVDSTELHQVLLNLATNAWHALEGRAGRIRFSVDSATVSPGRGDLPPDLKPGRFTRIVVSDNGRGIAAHVLPRIFDPFFTTKGPGEGTGLGLSVVHGIARANGGAVSVTSIEGAGSSFELYFPASTASRTTPPIPVPAGPNLSRLGRGEPILFVDDEEALILVADRVLTRAGYAVTTSLRPRQALEHFRAHAATIRLVVSDLSMPEMSGIELARELLRIRPDLPIILTSGYLRPGEAEKARQLGVREIVEKPNTPHDLLPVIDRVLKAAAPSAASLPTGASG